MPPHAPARGPLPLTLAQKDFWEEFSLHPDLPVSTVAHRLDVEGAVDIDALAAAISQTLREADVLSLRFDCADGGSFPLQRCDPARAPRLRIHDLSGHADPGAEARAMMQADVEARLDLRRQPLAASWLFRCSETRAIWYLRGHHIILDGYGMALLEQRCARLYRQKVAGTDAGAGFARFEAFLDEEQAYQDGPRRIRDAQFWAGYLAGAPDPAVLDKGGEDYGAEGHHGERVLTAATTAGLRRVSEAAGIGWPDLLVALAGIYLSRRPVEADVPGEVMLWTPLMNRLGSVAAQVPALVVNILPVRVAMRPAESLGAAIDGVARDLRAQRRHGRYRVEQLAADLGIGAGRRFRFSPLVNVLPFDSPDFGSCRVTREVLASGVGDGFNLTFRGSSDGSALTLDLDAEAGMMSRDRFDRHLEDFTRFLTAALTDGACARPVAALLPDAPAAAAADLAASP